MAFTASKIARCAVAATLEKTNGLAAGNVSSSTWFQSSTTSARAEGGPANIATASRMAARLWVSMGTSVENEPEDRPRPRAGMPSYVKATSAVESANPARCRGRRDALR
jgi:hypothetical protein